MRSGDQRAWERGLPETLTLQNKDLLKGQSESTGSGKAENPTELIEAQREPNSSPKMTKP